MHILVAIALKSLLVAGLTLGLLQVVKTRSAAERSWIAHVGLLALVIMAFAPLALPRWTVEAPALFGGSVQATPAAEAPVALAPAVAAPVSIGAGHIAVNPAPVRDSLTPLAAATAIYAIPAALLLFITFLALARLVALRARADVLVDAHWLSALARAQRRMGFKHGTALLTSDDLASPISWGLWRPVILLNSRAVEAKAEAEAIIAHELAHVARMDWLKLLLARIATALFWFNPLVWVLAREAHQLREETADDTVLTADIAGTDYAQLLVGVARHECPSLLLGAHGVAPSKSSLARRVARVLDSKSVRGPVARSFAAGALVGAVLVAAPLAALNVAPATRDTLKPTSARLAAAQAPAAYAAEKSDQTADLPHIIARGVSTSVATAVAAATAAAPQVVNQQLQNFRVESPNGTTVERIDGAIVSTSPSGATAIVYPPDSQGRVRTVARSSSGATAVVYANADDLRGVGKEKDKAGRRDTAIETAIEMKSLDISPAFVAAMRAASPALRNAGLDDIVEMRAVGVTPEYVQQLTSAGYANLDADDLVQARAVGITPDYLRAVRATGVRPTLEELIELKTMGITPEEVARVRGSGPLTKSKMRQMIAPPQPPQPPDPRGG